MTNAGRWPALGSATGVGTFCGAGCRRKNPYSSEPLAKFRYRQSSFIVIPACFRPESRFFKGLWDPAFAGVTVLSSFARVTHVPSGHPETTKRHVLSAVSPAPRENFLRQAPHSVYFIRHSFDLSCVRFREGVFHVARRRPGDGFAQTARHHAQGHVDAGRNACRCDNLALFHHARL